MNLRYRDKLTILIVEHSVIAGDDDIDLREIAAILAKNAGTSLRFGSLNLFYRR